LARIELNIVALGNFTSVNTQIEALQAKIATLNKSVAGVGLGPQLAKDLAISEAAFKATMLSTGQFTMQTVKMSSETEKFGQALVAGKLKLSDYFNIITGKSGQAAASLKALAAEQVKLQNSIVMSDPMKRGMLSVYTPTQINAVADATKLATMQQNLYNMSLRASSTALITWGKNTQWAGRQLTVGLTMPMVMFGAAAVKSFKDTNLELTKLQRLYGEGLTPPSQAQLDKISGQVLNLGKQVAQQMGIAQTETVKVAASFAAMGREGQNLLDTTYQTQRLSKLGAVDAAAATNTVVALQNVYKVSTQDLAGAVNFLSDIQKQTTMTLGDMTEAIPRVGPIMRQLGGTYKDTAVMLVAMREAGIPAAQAANAIKSAMASIIAPTSAATKQFASFGINLNAIKNAGTPVQMIEALQASLVKLSPLVREQLIEKLFGKFQFARVSALLDNFGKQGSQTVNALKVAGATNAQLAVLANQEMKQATESQTAKWQRSMESFKATLYPVGQKFLEMGTMILNIANKIGKAFSVLPGPVKTFLGVFAGFAVLSGPIIMLTGLLGNFAGYILKTVYSIKELASGGKTFKELLTPQIIASQNAAQLFGSEIANDVNAVDLLTQAISRLTVEMDALVATMNRSAGGILTSATAATTAMRMEQMVIPGFAGGVFNLQGGGVRGQDSIPAIIAPGESVISTEMSDKYAPLVQGIITDSIPGYATSKLPRLNQLGGSTDSPSRLRQKLSDIRAAAGGTPRSGRKLNEAATWSTRDAETQAIRQIAVEDNLTAKERDAALRNEIAHVGSNRVQLQTMFGTPFSSTTTEADKVMFERGAINNYGSSISDTSKGNTSAVNKRLIDVLNKRIAGEELTIEENAALNKTISETSLGEKELLTAIQANKANMSAESEANARLLIGIAEFDKTLKISESQYLPKMASAGLQARIAGGGYAAGPIAGLTGITETQRETFNNEAKVATIRERILQDVKQANELEKQGLLTLEQKLALMQELARTPLAAGGVTTSVLPTNDVLRVTQEEFNQAKKIAQESGQELPKIWATAQIQGIKTVTPLITEAVNYSLDEVYTSVRASQEIASPSGLWARLVGKPQAEGVGLGFKEEMAKQSEYIQEELITVNEKARETIVEQNAITQKTMDETAPVQKVRGVGGVGMGKSMGIGMAAMMASPYVGKIGGGQNVGANMAGSALGAVGMTAMAGMFLAPEVVLPLMAVTAAAAAAYTGIKHLMQVEKEHQAQAKATFAASSDAASFFGNKVADLTVAMNNYNVSFATTAGSTISQNATELQNFITMIKSLPADNPLALLITNLKGMSNTGEIKKVAQDFVTMQVAIGNVKPEQAQKLLDLIFGSSGHTSLLGSVLPTAKTQLDAITLSLKNSSGNAQQFNQALGSMLGLLGNTSTLADFNGIMDAIVKALGAGAAGMDKLLSYYRSIGDTTSVKVIESLHALGITATADIGKIQKALDAGANLDASKGGKNLVKQADDYLKKNKDNLSLSSGTVTLTKDQTTALEKQNAANTIKEKSLQRQKDIIDKQLKQQKDITSEFQKQQQYQLSQADLDNQIRLAQASGDFLKASLLRQQKSTNTVNFANQNRTDYLQNQSDALGLQIANLKDQISVNKATIDANAAALAANTTATKDNTSQLGKGIIVNLPPVGSATVPNQIDSSSLFQGKPSTFGKIKVGAAVPTSLSADEQQKMALLGYDLQKEGGLDWSKGGNREDVKALAKAFGYDKKGEFFTLTGKNGTELYEFEIIDDKGNVQLEGRGKQGQIWDTHAGKFINPPTVKKASGGQIRGAGTGTSDSIPAYLSNGEYVVKADSVSHYGTGLFDAINAKKFASGGLNIGSIGMGMASRSTGNFISRLIGNIRELAGISPTQRILTGHKENNWDYLGMASMMLGPMKGIGLLPKLLEMADITQFGLEKKSVGFNLGGPVKLPSFDIGTNFVPQDMIAQIHKGEAIIPAAQNNGTMGSTYNITVNAGSNASADDIAKTVMDTIKRNAAMTSTNRSVRV
jgi:TP901 family phage tail tape measure protein